MNIFTQLLKPFLSTTRTQENIDFDEDPQAHDDDAHPTDIRPVMFIKASAPETTAITSPAPLLANLMKTTFDTSTSSNALTQTKLRKSSTSSTTSSGIIWPFGRQSTQIVPEETAIKPQLCAIEEASESSAMISHQDSSHDMLIHPYQILSDTLYGDSSENLGDYTFHCTNISENLKPFIHHNNFNNFMNDTSYTPNTPHNLVDNIQYLNTYSDIIANSNSRSISCPNMSNFPWQPPKRHGLQNSARIIPDYYFQTHQNIQKLHSGEPKNRLLEIDYLFIIKDDIRNMRKLNQYQIDYIRTLDDATKNEIICEFHKACNTMIETITLMRSRESSPQSSSSNLLAKAMEELELDSSPPLNARKHIPRISSI